jgi:hypothetical protein
MFTSRLTSVVVGACVTLLLAACGNSGPGGQAEATVSSPSAASASAGNPITGQGLPNPAPNVTRNWGQLPAGRTWGTTAGVDIEATV